MRVSEFIGNRDLNFGQITCYDTIQNIGVIQDLVSVGGVVSYPDRTILAEGQSKFFREEKFSVGQIDSANQTNII